MKNYNEQLNQKGDCNFIMKKTITKTGDIKKAFIYIPDNKDKIGALCKKLDYDNPDSLIDSFICIADNKILLKIEKSGDIYVSDYKNKGLTGRGIRLNEKYIEGAIDYVKTYLHKNDYKVIVDESLTCKADCFKTKASELTIDDLLDL